MLDAVGEEVVVTELRPGGTYLFTTVRRRDGSFAICTATDAAETIVFVRDGEELRRAPFDSFAAPLEGGVSVLRY